MLFFVLFSVSFSYFCKETLEITKNIPENYWGPLGDGDRLCINSTVPFLAVAFQHTNLLKIRYFSRHITTGKVQSSGHLYSPSEETAIGFGNTIGHLEIQALLPGTVSVSTFAYPSSCQHHRYFTTMTDDTFDLAQRLNLGSFAEVVSSFACIWSPHRKTSIEGEANADSRSSIQVCNQYYCETPLDHNQTGKQTFEFSSEEFVKLNANKPDFIDNYQMTISVKESNNYLDSHGVFENEGEVSIMKLHPRDPREEHLKVEEEEPPPVPEKTAQNQVPINYPPRIPPFIRHRRRSDAIKTILTTLEIIALAVIIVGVIVCIVVIFLVPQRRDDAESTLLGTNQAVPGVFSRVAHYLPQAIIPGQPNYGAFAAQWPVGYGSPYPYPSQSFPGAVFPSTPNQPPSGDGSTTQAPQQPQ